MQKEGKGIGTVRVDTKGKEREMQSARKGQSSKERAEGEFPSRKEGGEN